MNMLCQNNVESMFIQRWDVDLKFFQHLCLQGFVCVDVGFWLFGCWILVVSTLDFGRVDV